MHIIRFVKIFTNGLFCNRSVTYAATRVIPDSGRWIILFKVLVNYLGMFLRLAEIMQPSLQSLFLALCSASKFSLSSSFMATTT